MLFVHCWKRNGGVDVPCCVVHFSRSTRQASQSQENPPVIGIAGRFNLEISLWQSALRRPFWGLSLRGVMVYKSKSVYSLLSRVACAYY